MLELAEELQHRGHQITVITTWPQYNLSKEQNDTEENFEVLSNEKGIQVLRVRTLPHHKVNYIIRGLSQLAMPLQFLWKLKQYKIQTPDAVVVYSPPLPLALVGSWFYGKGIRNILNVQDLFPQNAIDLGVLTHPALIRFFQMIEHLAYRTAHIVTTHSQGNYDLVAQNYPRFKERLRILHNWVDMEHHETAINDPDFRKQYGIEQSCVAVFAGVLGPSQYLNLLLDVAEKMQDCKELLFLIVGDGAEKENLQQSAQSKNLNNVMFQPFVSRDDYPALLDICSIGLVCLSPKNQTPVVPGKVLGYMATSLPVVAFLHSKSDGHSLIKESGCGVSAISDDSESAHQVMRNVYNNRDDLSTMGNAGQNYARQHFSKEACVSQLEELLK